MSEVDLELVRAFENNGARFVGYFENPMIGKVLIRAMMDEGFIDKETLFWIDNHRGKKERLISILIGLNKKDLFIQHFSDETLLKIAKRIFGMAIGKPTLKNTSATMYRDSRKNKAKNSFHGIDLDGVIYHAEATQRFFLDIS